MNADETAEEQRERTAAAYRKAGLTLELLWLHYFSIGAMPASWKSMPT